MAQSLLQCGRSGFDPWVGKIPWRKKWQPTPVFLPGESHGQRNLVGYSPWGHKESDMTEQLHFTCTLYQNIKIQTWKMFHIKTLKVFWDKTNIDLKCKEADDFLRDEPLNQEFLLWMWKLDYKKNWKKKIEHRRIDAFELWCWKRLLRVPWTARRSNQSILKEISPGCSLEGPMLKLKLQ